MTATPVATPACGHGFGDGARVIRCHVVGMFAPSFVTGALVARWGVRRVNVAGATLGLAGAAAARGGLGVANVAAAPFLAVVGWNLMFVGGTTLLTTCHTPAEKAKVQGVNDLLVVGTVAISAGLSGVLFDRIGWEAMNLAVVPALLAMAILSLFPGYAAARPDAAPA